MTLLPVAYQFLRLVPFARGWIPGAGGIVAQAWAQEKYSVGLAPVTVDALEYMPQARGGGGKEDEYQLGTQPGRPTPAGK